MTKEQRKLKDTEGMNKWEMLKQLISCHLKFLEDGFMQDGVENVHYIYLKHHPIGVDIQSCLNTMDHYFATTPNHLAKLMR